MTNELEQQLQQARALLKRLYAEGVDDAEGDCLYCGAEGDCYDGCLMLEVEEFLGIEIPEEDHLPGGPQRRYAYVNFDDEDEEG